MCVIWERAEKTAAGRSGVRRLTVAAAAFALCAFVGKAGKGYGPSFVYRKGEAGGILVFALEEAATGNPIFAEVQPINFAELPKVSITLSDPDADRTGFESSVLELDFAEYLGSQVCDRRDGVAVLALLPEEDRDALDARLARLPSDASRTLVLTTINQCIEWAVKKPEFAGSILESFADLVHAPSTGHARAVLNYLLDVAEGRGAE